MMFNARMIVIEFAAFLLLSACGARTEILAVADRTPIGGADADAATPDADAASACGGGSQACCMGTGCAVGLACNGGTCTPPGQTSLVLFGGCTGDVGCPGQLDDTWLLRGSTWANLGPPLSPPARYAGSMATLGRQIVLFGGGGGVGTDVLDDTWILDGASGTQVTVSTHPPGRYGGSTATLGNQVVLFGGFGPTNAAIPQLTDTWVFDGALWTEASASSPPPQFNYQAMTTFGGHVFLVGETYGNFEGHFEAWAFDGSSWSKVGVPPLPRHLQVLSAATLGSNLVVFLGGAPDQVSAFENQTWTFDGSTWSQVAASNPTPVRGSTTILSLDGRILLVGGEPVSTKLTQPLGDLWSFDGSSWSTLSATNAPAPRVDPTLGILP